MKHDNIAKQLLLVFVTFLSLNCISTAGTVEYSWSGVVKPMGDNDPWNIGSRGKPFNITVSVDREAVDEDVRVDMVLLTTISEASLEIDGLPTTRTGPIARLRFLDDSGLRYDIITFTSDFEFMGNEQSVTTGPSLPRSTFSFSHSIELPPVFGAAKSRSHAGLSTLYSFVTPAGTTVFSIPEPTTCCLLLLGSLLLSLYSKAACRH